MSLYSKFFKRFFDFIGAFFLIIALSPLYVIFYFLIRFNMGKPVLFTQARPGKNEKIFNIYKFRSMNSATDADGNLLPDKDRLTLLGKFLRKTSVDEIPQFFNILKGDMSFIGPRPLLPQYLPYYTQREKTRHDVRPGVTGLAQVNGRNCISWNDKLELDAQYVENLSFVNDVKIVFATIKNVLTGKDVEVATSEKALNEERCSKNQQNKY